MKEFRFERLGVFPYSAEPNTPAGEKFEDDIPADEKRRRVDELMAMAAVESDPAKRTALYAEFQQIIADELPVYHINTLPYHTVYSDKIGNPPLGIWGTSTPIDKVYLKP